MRTITLEEHFVSRRFIDLAGIDLGAERGLDLSSSEVTDLAALRLRHMDESGIDMQVISHVLPTVALIPPSQDQDIATAANDQTAAATAAHPGRFAAFAALPMSDPQAAVAELRRAVNELGFVGALINGRANGTFLDAPAYRPLLQTAVDLDVPLYLHPGPPTATLREEHYIGLGPSVSYALATTGWGWHAETGLHALRLIAAGIFDQLPNLQIILGHMGEMIPFMLNRADEWLTPAARTENNLELSVAETFQRNFWITTSGNVLLPPVPAPTPSPRTRPTALLNRLPVQPQHPGTRLPRRPRDRPDRQRKTQPPQRGTPTAPAIHRVRIATIPT